MKYLNPLFAFLGIGALALAVVFMFYAKFIAPFAAPMTTAPPSNLPQVEVAKQ